MSNTFIIPTSVHLRYGKDATKPVWLIQNNTYKPVIYKSLGTNHINRCQAYKNRCSVGLNSELIGRIQQVSSSSTPLGDNKFKQHIEQTLKLKLGREKRGRPLKT